MPDRSMSIGGWLTGGWEVFRANASTLIIGGLIWGAFYLGFHIVGEILSSDALRVVLQFVVGPSITVGWIYLCLRLARGEQVPGTAIMDGFNFFVPALLANLFLTVIIGVGFILLVIPGIFLAVIFCMTYFALVDKNLSAVEAMKFSVAITKGHA